MFCYENCLVYPVHVSNEKFENCMELLLITDDNKSHYVYIKDFNKFMCHKTKNKNKKYFCKYRLQCFSSETVVKKYSRIEKKIAFEFMCFVMKIVWFILFMYQTKNLKIAWSYC